MEHEVAHFVIKDDIVTSIGEIFGFIFVQLSIQSGDDRRSYLLRNIASTMEVVAVSSVT